MKLDETINIETENVLPKLDGSQIKIMGEPNNQTVPTYIKFAVKFEETNPGKGFYNIAKTYILISTLN